MIVGTGCFRRKRSTVQNIAKIIEVVIDTSSTACAVPLLPLEKAKYRARIRLFRIPKEITYLSGDFDVSP